MITKILTAVMLILSGTIAGYITNKYAVKWLFKPVKLFGKELFDVSILGTDEKQEAFIDSLSDCVEQKILTNEILRKEFLNDTMKSHIDEIVDYFIDEALPDSFKKVRFNQLKGFSETGKSLRDFVSDILNEQLSPLAGAVLDSINISEYISEDQIDSGSDNLYDCIKHAVLTNQEIKDQIGGIIPELLFTSMFNSDGRSAIGKLAGILFKGGFSSDMSSMSFPEKISMSVKRIISSAVSGFVENRSVNSYLKPESREMLVAKLRDRLMKKYDDVMEEISDKNIGSLTSVLSGNEKIKRLISDMIYDYLNKNINSIIGGRVKETTAMALGRLDPDQLCDVAERLMRGELKYLSLFGGAIGFLLSIPALFITLGSFTPFGFPLGIGSLIFLIILMGGIGVLTNVIAIWMFFHPYKEIGFLAKFKHTRCFSRGLILQNQKVFAHTLGEYIGTELLTAQSIGKMLEHHKDSFIGLFSRNIYPYIIEFLKEQSGKRMLSARISAFVFNRFFESKNRSGEFISDKIGDLTFGSIINLNDPITYSKASELYLHLLDKLSAPPDPDDSEAYDFRFISYALSGMIKESPSLRGKVWNLLETFYTSELADRKINSFFVMNILADSISKTIGKLFTNYDAFEDFRTTVDLCINRISDDSDRILSPEFAEDISKKCAVAIYDSIQDCLPALVKDIHIAAITEERVASLSPEEIQSLVRSFASDAFKKLYALGSIGCVFGINTYLAFLFFIIDRICDRNK